MIDRKKHPLWFLLGCIIGALLALMLGGCATPPQFLAQMYDNQDRCQLRNNKSIQTLPSWCGAGSKGAVITDSRHNLRGYIK